MAKDPKNDKPTPKDDPKEDKTPARKEPKEAKEPPAEPDTIEPNPVEPREPYPTGNPPKPAAHEV